jgi:hypothetical protein
LARSRTTFEAERVTPRTLPLLTFALLGLLLALAPPGAGAATIEGKVIHPTRPEAGAELPVALNGFGAEGEPFEATTATDASGRFAFQGLPSRGAFVLGATFEGIRFPGGSVVFGEEEPETQSVVFHVYDRTSDPEGVRMERMRLTLTREGGTYRAEHRATIRNPHLQVVVVGEASPPIVRIALPPGHGELLAPFGRLPEGTQLQNGAAEIRGPLFPGEQSYALAYDLAGTGDSLEMDVRLADALPELELLVRDFGVRVEAEGLHPARPVKQGDSIYLRYLGFDLAKETHIPLRVIPLAPPRTPSRWLQGLLVLTIGGALLLIVVRPIEAGAGAQASSESTSSDSEREAIVAALEDLEFDYETGKLSEEDRDRLGEDLRQEAVRTLARARAREEPSPPGACRCGRVPQPGDRFCSQCGAAL